MRGIRHAACAALVTLCWARAATADETLKGKPVAEVLGQLQHEGLRIVFSSEIVPPDLRVPIQPHGRTPRERLNEILSACGLKVEDGPGGTLLIVRAAPSPARSSATPVPVPPAPRTPRTEHQSRHDKIEASSYTDHVTVTGTNDDLAGAPSTVTLDSGALRSISNERDGGDVAKAMPGIVATDDFRSDFSLRGSPHRQIGTVIDDVATRWLQHTVYGRKDVASLPMLDGGIVQTATLHAGAYPLQYDEALGGQLGLTLREGARDTTRIVGTLGGMTAAVLGEGPLASGRGSWIGGVRDSYRSWPPGAYGASDAGLFFTDFHAKVVYSLAPSQQISVTALAGRSLLDTMDEPYDGRFGTSVDRAGLLTVAWRSIAPRTVFQQRVFVVGQDLMSTASPTQLAGHLTNREIGYRGDTWRTFGAGLLNAGVEVSALSGVRSGAAAVPNAISDFSANWSTQAAFATFSRKLSRTISFEAGARVSHTTLVSRSALSPWLVGSWRPAAEWTVHASTGVVHQMPDVDEVLGAFGAPRLRPERAIPVDVGIERRIGGVRLQADFFHRDERNVLREPDPSARLVDGQLVTPTDVGRYQNALTGTTQGVDLRMTLKRAGPITGWLSYTWATTRQHDVQTGETFFADFDRRHAMNATTSVLIPDGVISLNVRAASGVPIPGYFAWSGDQLVVGAVRNDARLPSYVRVDLHTEHTLSRQYGLIIFGDVVNALNAPNQGGASGSIDPAGQVTGFLRPLSGRRVSAGITVTLSH